MLTMILKTVVILYTRCLLSKVSLKRVMRLKWLLMNSKDSYIHDYIVLVMLLMLLLRSLAWCRNYCLLKEVTTLIWLMYFMRLLRNKTLINLRICCNKMLILFWQRTWKFLLSLRMTINKIQNARDMLLFRAMQKVLVEVHMLRSSLK